MNNDAFSLFFKQGLIVVMFSRLNFCLQWFFLCLGMGIIFCRIIESEAYLRSRRALVVTEKQTSEALIDLREELEGVLSRRRTAGKQSDFEGTIADLLSEQARVLCKMTKEFGRTLPLLSKAIQVIPDKNKRFWGSILMLFWGFWAIFGFFPIY